MLPDYTQYSRPTFNFGQGQPQSRGGYGASQNQHPFFGKAAQSYVQDTSTSPGTGMQPGPPRSGIEPPNLLHPGPGPSDPGNTVTDPPGFDTPPGNNPPPQTQLQPSPALGTGNNHGCNPFFDPNCDYSNSNLPYYQGSLPGQGQAGNNAFNAWATDNPDAYYYSVLGNLGYTGLDARSKAAQGLYGQYARGYQAAKTKNAELYFPEYLSGEDIASQIRLLSDEQLGIDRQRFAGDGRRFGLRS